jgi:hypothetical protein
MLMDTRLLFAILLAAREATKIESKHFIIKPVLLEVLRPYSLAATVFEFMVGMTEF